MALREDFLWGTASASAQVEGAWDEDGKSPSIWDVAGAHVKTGENNHVACDHYHRYREDVALMKQMGVNSYRFSISWPRVMPEKGRVNPKGLSFYSALVDELRANGIEPIVTLYHWDLPTWAQDEGGWKNDRIVEWYLDYITAVVDALSDRVQWWMTFNEPQCFLYLGYVTGDHAPFKKEIWAVRRHHVRNFLLAHGRAVKRIRARAKTPPRIGLAFATTTYIPASESAADLRDAARKTFTNIYGDGSNGIYADPILLGRPSRLMRRYLSADDLAEIHQELDFIGLNVYQPNNPVYDKKGYAALGLPTTMMGWPVDPRCMYWSIRHYYGRYRMPIMVSENGIALPDAAGEDGRVHDPERSAFLDAFLGSMKRAADEGIPVIGYQHWATTDNFEWAEGTRPRFGLIHVDYTTQKRTLKDSAYHYAEIIRTNGADLPTEG